MAGFGGMEVDAVFGLLLSLGSPGPPVASGVGSRLMLDLSRAA